MELKCKLILIQGVSKQFTENAYYEKSMHVFQHFCTKIKLPLNSIFHKCFEGPS